MSPETRSLLVILAMPLPDFDQFGADAQLRRQAAAFKAFVRLGFVARHPIARTFVKNVANSGYVEDEATDAARRPRSHDT
jgi:hypothetical protein